MFTYPICVQTLIAVCVGDFVSTRVAVVFAMLIVNWLQALVLEDDGSVSSLQQKQFSVI